MGKGKVQVWIVKPQGGDTRLIRGTLKEVEQKLRGEVSIEPCKAEEAHGLSDVEIEDVA